MYINTTTLMQLSESEIRALNPNTSYPVPFVPPTGYKYIFPAPQPTYDPVTQRVQAATPELTVLGNWEQRWSVVELYATQEDKDAAIAANQAADAARIQAAVVTATQLRLDTFAQTRNYDGILSACTYATSSVPRFAAEGQAAVDARDATWSTLYTLMGEVLAGTRPMPSGFGDVAPLLPALEWPL